MKDGIFCGVVIGMIAGALLYKYNPCAQQVIDDAEKTIKKEMNQTKQTEKKA